MHRDLLPGIPFSFENWEHCTLKLPAPTLLRRFHPSAPTVCDPHLLPPANTIPGELSATLSATWKAAENDCLERRNSIRPCVPSHVAYKAERGGNELFWSPWKKCIHARKSGAETVRQRCICQH